MILTKIKRTLSEIFKQLKQILKAFNSFLDCSNRIRIMVLFFLKKAITINLTTVFSREKNEGLKLRYRAKEIHKAQLTQ